MESTTLIKERKEAADEIPILCGYDKKTSIFSQKSRVIYLDKANAVRFIFNKFGPLNAPKLNNRTAIAVAEPVLLRYKGISERKIMLNLAKVDLTDIDRIDLNIVNRMSLLKRFIKTNFSDEESYTGTDLDAYQEFKILSTEKRKQVLDDLRNQLDYHAPRINGY